MCGFLYVALAACALQATAIQAEPVDSLHVQADKEELGRINLPSTALQVSTPGTARKRLRADSLDAADAARTIDKDERETQTLPPGVRIARKIVLGTAMGAVLTGVSIYVQAQTVEHSGDPFDGIGFLFNGIGVGCSVGFPLGITLADPHDSFSKTMLAGVLPGAFGVFVALTTEDYGAEFLFSYLVPLFSSIIVSEKSRKSLKDRAVSLDLSPTSHGGLAAVAKLQF